ncbi:hypothetical protein H6F67_10670 [Microcoleus sp. FACHB-1515]|uniref:hypothetical protein n=1 Tax=Cyanophyceae TaxID=3028117 RepID=UPI001682792F|nr:hypothetical protein [Microcoleus sp. FACHB-1515]MBD2090316.1 hypothetical protein [Microcoleus sp. FACHB-1515]
MASVDRIKSEIVQLEQATQAIAQEFRDAYTQYLTALAKAMQQQLILASFRLCTQGYPDRFLKLSFDERQRLQQALRQVGQQAIEQLMLPLQEPSSAPEFDQTEDDDEFDEMLFVPQADDRDQDEAEADETSEADEDAAEDDELLEVTILQLRFDEPIPPKALQQWREGVEANVAIVLQTISQAANRLLHQAKILPKPLPPVLEVAAQTGIVAESASSTPNLLNLLIDTGGEAETKMTQIIAIRLRLAEIEFAEPALTNGRSQIRALVARLQQLERNYRKKQRDRAVAEAEAAWRSAWYEE